MISISEARACILERAWRNPPRHVLLHEAVAHVLAEDVVSDIDSPPHDKALVNGFALRSADITAAGVELEIIERIMAGGLPTQPLRSGTATQIMTGAILPPGADGVVMVEQTSVDNASQPERVRIEADRVVPGQNIMRRGAAMMRDSVVLSAGHVVRPVDVGLLAEVGRVRVAVIGPPSVAVLATGNELVAVDQFPRAGMIRNSNGPMLCAMARAHRARTCDLGIGPDDQDLLRPLIERGLTNDVLVVSGGVSAGVLDLVPHVLEKLGVQRLFHKIRLKPGKPMWFGVYEERDRTCLVFGLPGNPVGSLVCFELLVAPVLRKLGGVQPAVRSSQEATLTAAHDHDSDRPTYHPAYAQRQEGGRIVATPVSWKGSADQRAIGVANCLILLPSGRHRFAAGHSVELVMFPGDSPL